MTTHPRERDRRRARTARRRRATPPERHREIDTAGENAHAVRLVGQPAAETGKEAGEISPVARTRGFGTESERSGSRGGRLRSSIPG